MRLHCNGSNSYLFAYGVNMYQFKTKDSKIKPYHLCPGNISKDLTVDSIKKNWDLWTRLQFFC